MTPGENGPYADTDNERHKSMDSQIKLIKTMLEYGKLFTFENFSSRQGTDHRYGGDYTPCGGDDTPEWLTWKTRVENIIDERAGPQSPARKVRVQAWKVRTNGNGKDQFAKQQNMYLQSLQLLLDALADDRFGELATAAAPQKAAALSNKIFVVHGHDNALKTDVEQFLHSIGLEPVVLHRQVDCGMTVIEKFEEHSDVGFAIVLLTPDEVSYLAAQESVEESLRVKESRARPNVIFEFGYFVGKLGRNRVCCLHRGNVALPSDLSGLIYKKLGETLDSQGLAIIRELKAAGYSVRI